MVHRGPGIPHITNKYVHRESGRGIEARAASQYWINNEKNSSNSVPTEPTETGLYLNQNSPQRGIISCSALSAGCFSWKVNWDSQVSLSYMGSELCSCKAGMARLSCVGWKPLQFCKPRDLQEVTLSLDVLTLVLSLGGSQGRSPWLRKILQSQENLKTCAIMSGHLGFLQKQVLEL